MTTYIHETSYSKSVLVSEQRLLHAKIPIDDVSALFWRTPVPVNCAKPAEDTLSTISF